MQGAGSTETSTPSMPHCVPLRQSRLSRTRRSFPACSAIHHLLANQRASWVLVQEAGGATAPAQRELVRGVEGLVPKWRSAATASPSLHSGTRGERAAGLGSRRAGRRARGRTARSLRGAVFRRRYRTEWGLCRVIASSAGPRSRACERRGGGPGQKGWAWARRRGSGCFAFARGGHTELPGALVS